MSEIQMIDTMFLRGLRAMVRRIQDRTCRAAHRTMAHAMSHSCRQNTRVSNIPERVMSPSIEKKLVIAISSRALFDLDESHQVFEKEGVDAYCRYQIEHEEDVLAPGIAFPLVKKLLALNGAEACEAKVVCVLQHPLRIRASSRKTLASRYDMSLCNP